MTNITEDIKYIGVNDREIDLFEGQYEVPNGMMSCSISGAAPSRTVASSSLSAVRMRVAAATACRTRYRSLE